MTVNEICENSLAVKIQVWSLFNGDLTQMPFISVVETKLANFPNGLRRPAWGYLKHEVDLVRSKSIERAAVGRCWVRQLERIAGGVFAREKG